MGIIYKVENMVNGKIYIGKTIRTLNNRRYQHEYRARYNLTDMAITNAIRKYGKDCFKWTIIDEHDDIGVLNMLERLHISRYESLSPNGYNLREGGEGGMITEESRNKMSISAKNRCTRPEDNNNYGKKASIELRSKLSKSQWKSKYPGSKKMHKAKPGGLLYGSFITYNGYNKYLGGYHEPYTASLVYKLVWDGIYG